MGRPRRRTCSALDKPLWTAQDLAEVLGVAASDVPGLARAYDVAVVRDEKFGLSLSIRQARRLVIGVYRKRAGRLGDAQGPRFDRQAMLWAILQGDPKVVARPPRYSEELEQELIRIAGLEEPTRTRRMHEVWKALQDAGVLAGILQTKEDEEDERGERGERE